MKKVKALWTTHGSYGTKKAGEEFEVQDSVATEMKKNKIVEIIGDVEEVTEKETKKAEPEVKEKVQITDNTVKAEKKSITKPGKAK